MTTKSINRNLDKYTFAQRVAKAEKQLEHRKQKNKS